MLFKRKNKEAKQGSENRWLIVGLGNPGDRYRTTWHNIGFMCMDMLSQKENIPIKKIKFKGIYGMGRIEKEDVVLLKPMTYMNNSGESVGEAAAFFKIPPERIIVIYDDVDIKTGTVRIRMNGGPGTHNGMKSVIAHMGTEDFPRIRIGIGSPKPGWDLADHVLSQIPEEQKQPMFDALERAVTAIEEIMRSGIQKSMNIHNSRKKQKKDE